MWKNQCLFSTTVNKSFNGIIKGDQLYLNKWPEIFKKQFYGIKDKQFNIGAWNIGDHKFYYKKDIIHSDKKKLKMVHANFIEFTDNEIILINKKNLRIINNIIHKNYLTTSENYGIKKFNLYKINILIKIFIYILKITSFLLKGKAK